MASGFSVHPGALAGLSCEMEQAAAELRQALPQLEAAASPRTGLFGLLAPSAAAEARYREIAREALDGLEAAAAALDQDVAAGLRATAAGYLASDEASALR